MSEPAETYLGGPKASHTLADQAPVFAPLVERFGPATVEADREPFPALVEAICSQQLSVQAAATVYGRIQELCEDQVEPRRILDADTQELRGCGLSGSKVTYVKDLAEHVLDGRLALHALDGMEDEQILDALTDVKGIGPWTAQMALIFTLHRPDVLPTGDLGVRDGARIVLGLDAEPTPSELRELAEPWRPYRSVASWYIWRERDRQLAAQGKR